MVCTIREKKCSFGRSANAVFILLAPATGKLLSSGQRIRITGISPLRGSLRAVSGSTIIILAVIAYIGSCPMVCDRDSRSSLRYPCLGLEDHGVPHKWLSPGLMSQCLAIQFSRFMREFRKDPSTYISSLGDQKGAPSIWEN